MESPFFSDKENARIRIKICGITRREDALAAIQSGADALGFNFWPQSKRALSLDQAQNWIKDVPKTTVRIAVVVNASPDLLKALRDSALFDAVQFHGDEPPSACTQSDFPRWIRALPAEEKTSLETIRSYATRWLLLDTACAPGLYGGSGENVDLSLARQRIQALPDRRILLAGGLTPETVAHAIQQTHPFGVDVASGVESSPGIKDPEKMRRFIAAARES